MLIDVMATQASACATFRAASASTEGVYDAGFGLVDACQDIYVRSVPVHHLLCQRLLFCKIGVCGVHEAAALASRHRYVDTHRPNGSQATVAPGRHVGCLQALGDRTGRLYFPFEVPLQEPRMRRECASAHDGAWSSRYGAKLVCLPAALGSTGGQARVKLHDDARRLVQRRLCRSFILR